MDGDGGIVVCGVPAGVEVFCDNQDAAALRGLDSVVAGVLFFDFGGGHGAVVLVGEGVGEDGGGGVNGCEVGGRVRAGGGVGDDTDAGQSLVEGYPVFSLGEGVRDFGRGEFACFPPLDTC